MYSYSQHIIRFWNRYNFAWPCRPEPSSDWTVLTTAVCRVGGLRCPVIWSAQYHKLPEISHYCGVRQGDLERQANGSSNLTRQRLWWSPELKLQLQRWEKFSYELMGVTNRAKPCRVGHSHASLSAGRESSQFPFWWQKNLWKLLFSPSKWLRN